MVFKFNMCAENVERSAAMDCSSPMSTSTRSKIGSTARCAATGMPDCAASAAKPRRFQRDRLAAGVRPADDQYFFRAAERERHRHDRALFAPQLVFEHGMPYINADRNSAASENSGIAASKSRANRPAREDTVKLRDGFCRGEQRAANHAAAAPSARAKFSRSPQPHLRQAG